MFELADDKFKANMNLIFQYCIMYVEECICNTWIWEIKVEFNFYLDIWPANLESDVCVMSNEKERIMENITLYLRIPIIIMFSLFSFSLNIFYFYMKKSDLA